MNPVRRLSEMGQSVWMDYIRRDLLDSGQLARWIADGEIRGVTSNPTIFEQAIAESELYTAAIRRMAQAGLSPEQILDALILEDIRRAADVLRPLYEQTDGGDGYVSIEVHPDLGYDTEASLNEARRLWNAVDRPNVMVKIPATEAGIPAIEQALAEGININITLIFSLERYAQVIEAYLRALETRADQGAPLERLASVASFFVSRVDTAVDARLESMLREEGPQAERAGSLLGKAAIANAKLAYAQFRAAFESERFERLRRRGARVQRPLWASTSTKNPRYPDTYYVDNLIGGHTVNTVPPATLDAFRDHGRAELTIESELSAARAQFEALERMGISMREVTQRLEQEGVAKFAESFRSLSRAVERRSAELTRELAGLLAGLRAVLAELDSNAVVRRLWQEDAALWTPRPEVMREIHERLGWLWLPESMPSRVEELEAFAAEVHAAGFDRCLLMGMGGSSLAADVLRRLPRGESGLELRVLDTTDPAQVQAAAEWCTQGTALYIVSSKSGTTAEPLALLEYFWERTGSPSAGDRGASFVAITDPGTPLESVARDRGFRRAFAGDPRVGGRYSALSVFGLVPATLLGLDLGAIAQRVRHTASACGPSAPVERNPGAFLGAILGAGARQGRDKVTFLADEPVAPLAEWIEQLLAESTGKQGRGLVPVVGEPVGSAGSYGADRLFVYLRSTGELDPRVKPWAKAGIPVAVVETGADAAGLAASFFEWEMAVAVACHLMGVNAFDQPDVERAKKRTTDLLSEYQRQGSLPQPDELWRGEGVVLLGRESDGVGSQASLREFAGQLLEIARQGRGLTLLAYLPRSEELDRTVAELRKALRDQFGMATAFGYGPRYLHSTGQLHKGGADGALYLIFTAEPEIDAEVPGAGYTFKTLQRAQAWGDLLALQDLNRQAFGLHLDRPGRALELIGTLRGAAQRARRESVRPGS